MMKARGIAVSIIGVAATFVAAPALAETNFPVIGGSFKVESYHGS